MCFANVTFVCWGCLVWLRSNLRRSPAPRTRLLVLSGPQRPARSWRQVKSQAWRATSPWRQCPGQSHLVHPRRLRPTLQTMSGPLVVNAARTKVTAPTTTEAVALVLSSRIVETMEHTEVTNATRAVRAATVWSKATEVRNKEKVEACHVTSTMTTGQTVVMREGAAGVRTENATAVKTGTAAANKDKAVIEATTLVVTATSTAVATVVNASPCSLRATTVGVVPTAEAARL